ncbi:mucin-13 [Ciconia maguari]
MDIARGLVAYSSAKHPPQPGNAANGTPTVQNVTTAPADTRNATNGTSTAPPVTTAPATTGNATNGTPTAPPVTTAPATTGNATNGTSTAPPVTTAPATTGNATNGTSTAPPVTTAPATTGNATNGTSTAPPVTTAPATTGKEQKARRQPLLRTGNATNGTSTAPPVTTAPATTGNATNGTSTAPPVTTAPATTGGRAALPMRVTVTNLFMENSTVDNETVSSAIIKAANASSYVSDYKATTYCAVFNCDAKTTDCEENVFPKCICKSGFSKTEWDDRSCSDCSKDCSAEENKYCAKENGVPICKCMTNFEMKNENCVSCPVGYSGDNCKNNSELILIIVGTVFGAIILSLVIAVSIVSVRAERKQDPEKKSLIKSRYSNPNTSDAGQTMMFPRVQTTSGHANPGYQPNNPYEMRSSNRDGFPERDYDDLYEVSREPEGFRMHNRY